MWCGGTALSVNKVEVEVIVQNFGEQPQNTPYQAVGESDLVCATYTNSNDTANSLLTDTLVSGQLYLRTLFSIPSFTSQSNSVFTHSHKRTLS